MFNDRVIPTTVFGVFLGAAALFSAPAHSTSYCVDGDSGDNAASGLYPSECWQTVSRAFDESMAVSMGSYDSLYLKEYVYHETIALDSSMPGISIATYPGDSPATIYCDNEDGDTNGSIGVNLVGANGVFMHNLRIVNCQAMAVWVNSGSEDIQIQYCEMELPGDDSPRVGYGVNVDSSSDVTIFRNEFQREGSSEALGQAMYTVNSSDVRLRENTVHDNILFSVWQEGCRYIYIEGNYFSGGHTGVVLDGGRGPTYLRDNFFEGQTTWGLDLYSDNNVVRDNIFFECSTAIAINGNGNAVTGNDIRESLVNGIVMDYGSANQLIDNQVFE